MKAFNFVCRVVAAAGIAWAAQAGASVADAPSGTRSAESASAGAGSGSVQFFSDQSAFDATIADVQSLDYESFDRGDALALECSQPINRESNDRCFLPTDLAAGFGLATASGTNLYVVWPNYFLQPTLMMLGGSLDDPFVVTFAPAVTAVSFAMPQSFDSGAVDLELFDEAGVSLATGTIAGTAGSDARFVGATSAVAIAKITVAQRDGSNLGMDDLRFGATGPIVPRAAAAFAPEVLQAGSPTTLTVSLRNVSQPAVATLSSDFIVTFPDGLTPASVPNATTTCGGTVDVTTTALTLRAGAQIPASSSCAFSIDAVAAEPGAFAILVARGALQTDLGSSDRATTATVHATSGGPATFPQDDGFDEQPSPALPSGWVSSTASGGSDWTTTHLKFDTGPNAAFAVRNGTGVSDYTLDSPAFVPTANQTVSFRYALVLDGEIASGAVLELSIDGGAFTDIVTSGGTFVEGGYNGEVQALSGSPLAGRSAWVDTTYRFVPSTVKLPAQASGKPVVLRFRLGYGSGFPPRFLAGWRIDSLHVGAGSSTPPSASVTPAALTMTTTPGRVVSKFLTIADAADSDTLTFSLEVHDASDACNGPSVGWLTARSTLRVLGGGENAEAMVRLDPSRGPLAAGSYSANVCIRTNDPNRSLIVVPVAVVVAPQPCAAADQVFCSGFDGSGINVLAGHLDRDITPGNGVGWNFVTQTAQVFDPQNPFDPVNLGNDVELYYNAAEGPGLLSGWWGGAPFEYAVLEGGVAENRRYLVLETGAVISSESLVWSYHDWPLQNWNTADGADGYLGLAFFNERTRAINYGYLHVQTTGTNVDAARALDWAYDDSGQPITVP